MSRLVASSDGAAASSPSVGDPIAQEIRVYQNGSGDMLLRVQCAPAVRSAENFDLSPDGETLVVLGPETLDLYRLPELSARDRKDLAEAQTMTPPVGSGPVVLAGITRPVAAPERVGGGDTVRARDEEAGRLTNTHASPTSPDTATAVAPSTAGQTGTASGDVPPGTARKPPTLLKPGESPDFKGGSGSTPR